MAVRVRMYQVKLQEFDFEYVESMTNLSSTYSLILSHITQCLFPASSTSEHAQLRPEMAITLQSCVAMAEDIIECLPIGESQQDFGENVI